MQSISHRVFRHHMMRNINFNNLGNLIGRYNLICLRDCDHSPENSVIQCRSQRRPAGDALGLAFLEPLGFLLPPFRQFDQDLL